MAEQSEQLEVGIKSVSLPVPQDSLGLGIDMSKSMNGATAAVNISENLPSLCTEIWYDVDGTEEVHLSDKEEFHVLPSLSKGGEDQNSGTIDKDRWDILMNKLTIIENNTSSLSADLKALTERVDANSEQIAANSEQVSVTKNAVSKNEKAVLKLDKKFDLVWAEVD